MASDCRARPVEQMNGADGAMDGKVFFRDHPDAKAKPQVTIFTVKGGNPGNRPAL